MKTFKKIVRRILFCINILLLLVFIFICFTVPHFSPGNHWPLGLLGLAFPVIFILVVAFILFWLAFYYKYSFFGIGAIIICWNFCSVFFAFNFFEGNSETTEPSDMIVMSYNVRYFKNFDSTKEANVRLRNKMIKLIAEQKPDILCLQEFHTTDKGYPNSKADLSGKFKLPYYHFSGKHKKRADYTDIMLFSRYPIINMGKVAIRKWSEVAIYADIKKAEDTFRVFTTHLRSIRFSHHDLQSIKNIKQQQGNILHASKVIAYKLRYAFTRRRKQAEALAKAIEASPYPVIVCGDFNDPPTSYSYFKVRGDLTDAFLEKGFGIGRTYSKISPTLRIDYIFTSPTFQIKDFNIIHKPYSDHFPIVARLRFVNN